MTSSDLFKRAGQTARATKRRRTKTGHPKPIRLPEDLRLITTVTATDIALMRRVLLRARDDIASAVHAYRRNADPASQSSTVYFDRTAVPPGDATERVAVHSRPRPITTTLGIQPIPNDDPALALPGCTITYDTSHIDIAQHAYAPISLPGHIVEDPDYLEKAAAAGTATTPTLRATAFIDFVLALLDVAADPIKRMGIDGIRVLGERLRGAGAAVHSDQSLGRDARLLTAIAPNLDTPLRVRREWTKSTVAGPSDALTPELCALWSQGLNPCLAFAVHYNDRQERPRDVPLIEIFVPSISNDPEMDSLEMLRAISRLPKASKA